MIIFSALLYILFVYCVANFLINHGVKFKSQHIEKQEPIAICFVLLSFLFVPFETLPPMVDIELGSVIVLLLLISANYLQDKEQKNYQIVAFLATIFALFSFFVYSYGIPGHLFCIGTYSSPLIWQVSQLVARGIYILLALIFVAFFVRQIHSNFTKKETNTCLLNTLMILLYIAIFSAIFFPVIPVFTSSVDAPSFMSYFAAFWVGWVKILVIYYLGTLLQKALRFCHPQI